ncbi:josephin protein [Salix suchowensis]|nr:josephin protein [Salix suchowensis]
MSARINQVNYNPAGFNQNSKSVKRNWSNGVSGNRWLGQSCGFRLLKISIMSSAVYLKHLGGKVVKALCLERRPSPGVSSSGRSRPSVAPIDAHRAEAIEDCIEFINSASLSRSNSITANPS